MDFETGCLACGRTDVQKRPGRGKQRFPHKCPHGVSCITGSRLMPVGGINGPARGGPHYCPDCVEAYSGYWRKR